MLTENNPMYIPMTMQMPMSPPPLRRLLAKGTVNGLSSVSPSQLSKPVRPLTAYRECFIIKCNLCAHIVTILNAHKPLPLLTCECDDPLPLDLFFQLEREYILQTPTDDDAANQGQGQGQADKRRIGKDIDNEMPSRYQLIHLNDEWYKSASGKRSNKNQPKRKHRKTHGKIGFLELSSVISKRWHKLAEVDPETKSFVAKVASRLLGVYKREMAEFKAQSMARRMSTASLFPVMSTSFQPNMSYLPQAPGMSHYPTANYSPPPTLPPCEAKKLPSPTTFGVDFDEVLQEEPVSFKTDQQSEEKGKELDPLSGFTFYPVTRHDYMKRKRSKNEDRHSKRSRHSSYVDGHTRKAQIESEKEKLKMGIRAMREQMWNERSTPSPSSGGDCYRAPCYNNITPCYNITPAPEGSDMIMCPVDAEDLMKALQGSELFA